jgi:oligopeptide/dipeptide ABC transporter ATP-binding protein
MAVTLLLLGRSRMSGLAGEILRVESVSKIFAQRIGLKRGPGLRAVNSASFAITEGEVLALVGESGSGKSTLGRLAIRVIEPTAGEVWFRDQRITALDRRALRPFRRMMQMVFQDPGGSLDPRMRVGQSIAEGIRLHRLAPASEIAGRVAAMLERVGLPAAMAGRYPKALSGGQRQRVGIARALAVEPAIVVADEPTSALDVSIQAEILDLLKSLQDEKRLAMLFISHDLRVVHNISDRVAVLYLGHIVEMGSTRAVYGAPRHPYTEALLSAVPVDPRAPRRARKPIGGEQPNPLLPPSGCVFHPRCPHAIPDCRAANMTLREIGHGHFSSCIRPELALTPAYGAF